MLDNDKMFWVRIVLRSACAVVLTVSVAVCAWVPRADARTEGTELGVSIAPLELAARGRVAIGVAISGFQPGLRPTIEGTITVGSQVIQGPPGPAVAAYLPAMLDMPAGTLRLGGVAIIEFAPIPPPAENTPIAVEITVRQGTAVATTRRNGTLLLPTVIVPGYLNDLDAKPDAEVVSVLEQRGYRTTGASPTAFWFAYPSRRFSLQEGARALANYVRQTVLPSIYASRINVVGYSEGGLLARWNLAFDHGWTHLLNRLVMVGVPNEGTAATYLYGWYPALAGLAATPAARQMLPTYPFWRPDSGTSWTIPTDGRNSSLALLNAQPLPEDVRMYALYSNSARLGTWAGMTGSLPNVAPSFGPGDGIVLTASALGLPINGGAGIPGLADRLIKVELGDVRHLTLLQTAMPKVTDVLTDRWVE